MPNTPAYDKKYTELAAYLAKGATAGGRGAYSQYAANQPTLNVPENFGTTGTNKEQGFSAGQGIIDALSSGSYAVAGIGKKFGENINAASKGDIGGILDAVNPFSLIGAGVQGNIERRTWSDNLKDLGVDDASSAGWGLALDIALDPFWLIPGGAVAAGVKGVSRGVVAGAAANRAGAKLTKEAFDQATNKLAQTYTQKTSKEQLERFSPLRDISIKGGEVTGPTAELYGQAGGRISTLSGPGASNLFQGVKQGVAENYAEWAGLRRIKKVGKLVKKEDTEGLAKLEEKWGVDPFTLLPTAAKVIDDTVAGVAAKAPDIEREIPDPVADAAEAVQKAVDAETNVKVKKPVEKDANAANEAVQKTLEDVGAPKDSINAQARALIGPKRGEYIKSRGITGTPADVATLAAVKTSELAGRIADEYERLVSNPNDPLVKAAYEQLAKEVEDQYEYMTKELGIKVEWSDADPYIKLDEAGNPVLNDAGQTIPDSAEMMKDVMTNGRMKVYKTADDQSHPILSADINNKFRAIHDYFGHAASGRGFHGDGEEAAWVSHSTMFSPLARRAMTTETRGQNSWVNKFGTLEKPFADQKAGLLPEEFTLLPSERNAIENQILATNSLIARSAATLLTKSDVILDDLGLVAQPMKGTKLYTAQELTSIKKSLEKVTDSDFIKPGSKEHGSVVTALTNMQKRLNGRTSLISEDLLTIAENLDAQTSNALSKILNTPVDATDLITAAAKADGRTLTVPKPFKPIEWAAPKKYGKPAFAETDIASYFPNDPILNTPKDLAIAMGAKDAKTRALKGETQEQALARKQALIWEQFRTRNADLLADAETAQRQAWEAVNQPAASELYTEAGNMLVGLGSLPLGLPKGIFSSVNGKPVTTLAQMVENISAMIIREPNRAITGLGDLNPMLLSKVLTKKDVAEALASGKGDEVRIDQLMFPEDQVLEVVTTAGKTKGARFSVVDEAGEPVRNFVTRVTSGEGIPAGVKLVAGNDAAKELVARLKALKPAIEIDRVQPVVNEWLNRQFSQTVSSLKSQPIRVAKQSHLIDEQASAILARKLMDENPAVKSFADAQLIVSGFEDAMKVLSKKPQTKYFVKRDELAPARGERKQKIDRSSETGAPNPYGEKYARTVEFGTPGQRGFTEIEDADVTLLTKSGSQYTGRKAGRDKLNREYQPQLDKGPQQLAAVSNVMKAIDIVAGAITTKELLASPEQAKFLANVLNELGVKTAANATPEAIFKQFEKDAKLAYQDLVEGIEAAAKDEAVMYQAQKVFTMSLDENLTIMEAVSKADPGELQRKVIQFTEDAVTRVDEACRARFGEMGSAPTDFLSKVIRGE